MANAAATLPGMAKSKPTGGKHKKKRVNVGVPEDWHAVMRRLSAKRQQPVVYLLIALVAKEAEEAGLTGLPPAPSENDPD